MSGKNKKQFGVWMDSHHATITGREHIDNGVFVVLGHVENVGPHKNGNEFATNHEEIALTHKFFKEIATKMPNVDEIHVTGTGQIQEEFIKFLADTPQYKNAISSESTANRMQDGELIDFVTKYYNRLG
ncbi:MAG TPA: hypothetical protein VK826_02460 [Bacteroidia bacterium]|nr:hypothetical protein [Bacteroidia bacterium]